MEQRTDEWFEARLGKFTASTIDALMGRDLKTDTAQTYINKKATETTTGTSDIIQPSQAMLHGTYYEPEAKKWYEVNFEEEIIEQPFIIPKWSEHCGCSPDGILKSRERGIEIKCPQNMDIHHKYLQLKTNNDLFKCNRQYYHQIQMCILICEIDIWDFVSYHPSEYFPDELRLFTLEIHRDEKACKLMQERIIEATEIKLSMLEKVQSHLKPEL